MKDGVEPIAGHSNPFAANEIRYDELSFHFLSTSTTALPVV
ncbi:hypothetical protein V22_04870 [Calycomorphotria hydatis]|uniref:Uncharacterized protein n=1 Tax=Calycomorphotria hydatis TaxID=2528027 RepID=A0A517T4H4_9PLAN|nr:hypothetical protein V22_04870 [Calycomorphotria hydatis]